KMQELRLRRPCEGRLIHSVIPSVERISANVESARDIDRIASYLGNVPVDWFIINTFQVDEEMKDALLRFYEHRKGRYLYIKSNVLLHIQNFEEAVMQLLALVDVTFHLVNVVNGITRPTWYRIFQAVVDKGGTVSVDGQVWPNENLEGYRKHTVKFALPRNQQIDN
ncbi:hypothetical protein PMAYCL1PPCAC_31020, partial [Pristionchus mayeri]